MIRRLAVALAAALPLAAAAQAAPAPAPASATPPAPAPAPSRVTIDWSGWAVLNTFATSGGLNANDLPRWATAPSDERTFGMSVRQSRIRAGLGLPTDGLLGGAVMKGLVEVDFSGGYAAGDESMPLVRLRHCWVQATWKDLGNLSLLLGQSWGLVGGPTFPASLGHLAVPRFSGAGLLYRRAPQIQLSGDLGGDLAFLWSAALLAPMDRGTAPIPSAAAPTSVGERSGMPDAEGRVALAWRPGRKNLLEVGLSGHAGQETYWLSGLATPANGTVDAWGGAADLKLEVPHVTVVGGAFTGVNLDVASTLNGVTLTTVSASDPRPTGVTGVATHGGWGQVQVQVGTGLQLLAGAGIEQSNRSDLPATGAVLENLQISGGAIYKLTTRWRVGLELTRYETTLTDATANHLTSGQLELSTLYAF